MSDIHDDMQKLATKIAAQALNDATEFDLRLDAFKLLTVFYGLMLKHETADEDADGATFTDFSKRLQESEHGSAEVRDRRRNGRTVSPES